jgi:hypothetical protein
MKARFCTFPSSSLMLTFGRTFGAGINSRQKSTKWPSLNNYCGRSLVSANFGSFALGSVLSWTSPALPDLRERRTFGEITDSEETWISSIALVRVRLSSSWEKVKTVQNVVSCCLYNRVVQLIFIP